MIRHTPFCLITLALTACGGDLESDYVLDLVPHVLSGQAPFEGERVLKLVVGDAAGETTISYLGPVNGEATLDNMPPIAEGGWVGIVVENAGGATGEYNQSELVAWGSAALPEALGLGGQTVEVDVLVAETGKVGDLGSLGDNQVRFNAAGAITSTGRVVLLCGTEDLLTTIADDRVYQLPTVDAGRWSFDKVGNLPDGGLIGLRAVSTIVDGQELIVVTGGRFDQSNVGADSSDSLLIWDPATDSFSYGDKDNHTNLLVGRSEHAMVAMQNGRVLIFGGFTNGLTNSIEMFNPKSKAIERINGEDFGTVYPAGTALGAAGALLCGGGTVGGESQPSASPVDACNLVNLQGLVSDGPNLPTRSMGLAMATLADGRVLVTGGVTTTAAFQSAVPATNAAWLYNGSTWNTLPQSMAYPRALHKIVPLPNGDAIVVGGTTYGGGLFARLEEAVTCPEYFDGKSQTFSQLPCTGAGAGANPVASWSDTKGGFVLAGEDDLGGSDGAAFGFIGFPPDL